MWRRRSPRCARSNSDKNCNGTVAAAARLAPRSFNDQRGTSMRLTRTLVVAAGLAALAACNKNTQNNEASQIEANGENQAENITATANNEAANITNQAENEASAIKNRAENKAEAVKNAAENKANAVKNEGNAAANTSDKKSK